MVDAATVEVLPAWKQILVVYGPLGILAALAVIVAYTVYKDRKAERVIFDQQLAEGRKLADEQLAEERKQGHARLMAERAECEKERRENQANLRQLEEKYVERGEKTLEKYHQLATALNQVLNSAMQRYPKG